jgi:hypothetical protein
VHNWGDEGVDWNGINDAGAYIGYWLRKWMRMDVRDVKEKFGTVRIYCGFGWSGLYSIYRPGYCWYPNWWPIKVDNWLAYHTPIFKWINRIVVPIQQKAYTWRYKKAVQKWPHLYNEIVMCADHGELFEGTVPGYVHSNYWTKVE